MFKGAYVKKISELFNVAAATILLNALKLEKGKRW
jgi:hypothetical protein